MTPMDEPQLVLASASPRRARILRSLGLAHRVKPAAIREVALPGELSHTQVERLSLEKARDVLPRAGGVPVLAGDTVVTLDHQVLGKPGSPEEAVEVLMRLSGRTHRVASGLALLLPDGKELSGVMETLVTFRHLSPGEAEAYVATGEPMDKAGGYGIQGLGATLVSAIQGDYSTVVGLPIPLLLRLLAEGGRPYTFPPTSHPVSEVTW
ncbi:MAG: Maf family protein [Gemmatimonadota bacterium]